MKKLFVLLMVVTVTITTNAQMNLGGGFGFSSKKSLVAEMTMGYDFKAVFVKVGYLAQMSNKTDKGAFFNAQLGHTVNLNEDWSIQPAIGYAYVLKTTDDKMLNKEAVIGSIYLVKNVIYQGQIYFGANYSDKTFLAVVGMRLNLEQ